MHRVCHGNEGRERRGEKRTHHDERRAPAPARGGTVGERPHEREHEEREHVVERHKDAGERVAHAKRVLEHERHQAVVGLPERECPHERQRHQDGAPHVEFGETSASGFLLAGLLAGYFRGCFCHLPDPFLSLGHTEGKRRDGSRTKHGKRWPRHLARLLRRYGHTLGRPVGERALRTRAHKFCKREQARGVERCVLLVKREEPRRTGSARPVGAKAGRGRVSQIEGLRSARPACSCGRVQSRPRRCSPRA